jgi:hypothetical protein
MARNFMLRSYKNSRGASMPRSGVSHFSPPKEAKKSTMRRRAGEPDVVPSYMIFTVVNPGYHLSPLIISRLFESIVSRIMFLLVSSTSCSATTPNVFRYAYGEIIAVQE